MPARRRVLLMRRLVAIAVAIALTAGIWLLLFRDGEGDEDGHRVGGGVSAPVAELVRRMTLAERVDQLLLLGFEGTDAGAPFARELVNRQLGGVLVEARNWLDAAQGTALVGAMRANALGNDQISPLFAVRQEGGEFRALPDLPPTAPQLDVASPEGAEIRAREAATALRSAGIDLNLAPVADVATLTSPIAARAFSDDADVTAAMTAAAVRGCSDGGIGCAVLHFPGLGAASQDTDDGPATVSLDATSLANRDLAAFRAAFAEDVPAVVLSHAFYAAYDAVTPASLTEPVATGLLRDELGYEGLAITDDLGAGAIKATYSVPEAAVAAIQAGADMLLISAPADQAGVAEALLNAVEAGTIDEERLNEAAGRVLELKRSLRLLRL